MMVCHMGADLSLVTNSELVVVAAAMVSRVEVLNGRRSCHKAVYVLERDEHEHELRVSWYTWLLMYPVPG